MRKLLIGIFALQLVGCASLKTGDDFTKVSPGMTQSEVSKIMGAPAGFSSANGFEAWQWKNLPMREESFTEGFARGYSSTAYGMSQADTRATADYYVLFKDGKVVEKGVGDVRQSPSLNVNMNAVIRNR